MNPAPDDNSRESFAGLESMAMPHSSFNTSTMSYTTSNADVAGPGFNLSNDTTLTEQANGQPPTETFAKDQNTLIHLDPIPNFKDKADIKPWLQKIFYPQGIEIVIERSDNIKVVFKCKAAKRGKQARLQNSIKEPSPNSVGVSVDSSCLQKKKRSVSRFNTCPFRIRATFSLKRKKWNVVVVNNSHSHPLKFNPDSEEYRKFKEKLKIDLDWDAVKKFDELEYRTISNLPIETSLITCECGLTNEIKSFNIVLPSTKSLSSVSTLPNASCGGTFVTKPKSKNSRQKQQRNKENLLKNTTTQNFLSNATHVHSPSIPGFVDDISVSNSGGSPSEPFLPIPESSDALIDLNEIDFTNIFNKPLHNHHHHQKHNNETNNFNDDNTGGASASVLFSPLTAPSNQYLSPTDELLRSPSQQIAPSISNHNSDSILDFVGKQSINFDYNDSSSSVREKERFSTPFCDLNNSNFFEDTSSQLNSNTRDKGNSYIGDVLSRELSDIKIVNGELKVFDEPLTTQVFNQTTQFQQQELAFKTFEGTSPWGLTARVSPSSPHDMSSTLLDNNQNIKNENDEMADPSLWDMNFGDT